MDIHIFVFLRIYISTCLYIYIFICLYFYASIFVDMQKYIIFALSNF